MYDYKTVRERIDYLTSLYRQLAKTQPKDGTWDWWIPMEIEALELEIAEAHKADKGKLTTVASNGQPVMQFENIICPIIPQWGKSAQHAEVN